MGRLEVFRKFFATGVVAVCFALASPALANPAQFDFEFGSGGGGTIGDFSVQWFTADPVAAGHGGLDFDYIELEIVGLTHPSPMDLNIFLLDPFGNGIEIIDDNGDQQALVGANLVFSDKGPNALPIGSQGFASGQSYVPLGPGALGDFTNTGTSDWRLVIIDDAQGGEGSFDSFTLRGVVVPEPATLSLLAIGAFAMTRRRRKV